MGLNSVYIQYLDCQVLSMNTIQQLIDQSRSNFDLSEPEQQGGLYDLAETMLNLLDPPARAELRAFCRSSDTPLEFKLASMLVLSRQQILQIGRPLKIAVLFAMWGEQNRLRPRSSDNPNGEDSLRIKVRQLEWITRDTPIEWSLYAIDDGCPHQSGQLARSIAETLPANDQVHVLWLAQALPSKNDALKNLRSANDSRKGGAIILGALRAVEAGVDAIVYTDADSSVHLGQLGLLLGPYAAGAQVVLGNRKDPDSILVKQEARWGIGIKLLRHMQRMVGREIFFNHQILDTQAAFKLYDRKIIQKILAAPSVYDFSFDSDWILATIGMGIDFKKIAFAFVDSFAESASIVQGPMTTWETLLLGLVKSVRARGATHDQDMARVLVEEIQSSKDLDILINHLPPQLEQTQADQLGDSSVMSPFEVQAWIRARKAATR